MNAAAERFSVGTCPTMQKHASMKGKKYVLLDVIAAGGEAELAATTKPPGSW